jgi:hypothetical protein
MYPSSSSGILERKINRVMQMFCSTVTVIDRHDLKSHPASNFEQLKSEFN